MSENMSKTDKHDNHSYRIQLFRDAQSWKKPDRIPFNADMYTWMFLDAGYTTAEAARNYDVIEKCMERFIQLYDPDQINAGSSGFRNSFLVMDSLGGVKEYNSETSENLNAIIEDVLLPEDYDAVLENGFNQTLWEKALFRKYPQAKDYTPEEFAQSAKTMLDLNTARSRIENRLADEYGTVFDSVPRFYPGYEYFFKYLRGIKGCSIDLRRCPEKVYAVSSALDEVNLPARLNALSKTEGFDMNQPYDIMISMLGQTILNRKQFDRIWVPPMNKLLKFCEEHNKQVFIFAEGSWERFGDYFNQFKKGVVHMIVEQDDPYEIRRKYPNIGIIGGLSTDVMGHGTPHECIDMAKKAIDELGAEGGLTLSPNKMISYANDMNAENLKAVSRFVHTYRW